MDIVVSLKSESRTQRKCMARSLYGDLRVGLRHLVGGPWEKLDIDMLEQGMQSHSDPGLSLVSL